MTITDLSDFIPLIERNKKQNLNCFKDENVQIAELDWKKYHDKNLSINGATTDPLYNKDYILVSDCIYYERKYSQMPLTNVLITKEDVSKGHLNENFVIGPL